MTSPWEEGNPNSKIAILGEAPARVEMRTGRIFSGPSGQLLNELLREAGIARSEIYLTNIFEFPVVKSKDEKLWFDPDGDTVYISKKGFTEKGLRSVETCLARLRGAKANVIVPLGGAPLLALYGDTRITKWRGSILTSGALNGRKIVPTFHTAFLLRGNYPYRYTVISDLKRVLGESKSNKVRVPERTLHINPIWPDVKAFFEGALSQKEVATDIEMLNHHISCFSIALSPLESMSIPIIHGQGDRWSEEQEYQIWRWYAELLGNPNIRKINHNILFDSTMLLQQNNIFSRGPLECTMCAQHIMYPDFPKGLDFLCSIRTREPYYKDDGKLWSKPWVDQERFWRYSALDSAVAFEAWIDLEKEMLETGYMEQYKRTTAMFPSLTYMMVHGIRLNAERLATTKRDAKERLARKEAELREKAEWDFNPGSPKDCREYFYVTKGIKPYTSVKTGEITTDDKALARIYKRYNLPEAKLAQEIRGLRKLISSYLEVQYDADERVRCSYNPRGTVTGRLSSSETIFGTGMNFQNLESEFKDFLEADDA